MRAVRIWTPLGEIDLEHDGDLHRAMAGKPVLGFLGRAAAACSTAELDPERRASPAARRRRWACSKRHASSASTSPSSAASEAGSHLNRFDPKLRLMSTVDERADGSLTVHAKGAPEEVLARSTTIGGPSDHVPLTRAHARGGPRRRSTAMRPRVSACSPSRGGGFRTAPSRRSGGRTPSTTSACSGSIALFDPPRPEVAEAVARCHDAGVRIIVVTGDHGLTAAEIARRVGIGGSAPRIVTDEDVETMTDRELDALLREGDELVFARSSPEAKLRIADALRAEGQIVAMTGDGVNDAPALRRADIGVAMGRSGTESHARPRRSSSRTTTLRRSSRRSRRGGRCSRTSASSSSTSSPTPRPRSCRFSSSPSPGGRCRCR